MAAFEDHSHKRPSPGTDTFSASCGFPLGRDSTVSRLLPKKIFQETFGLPKLEIGSPRYISRSPRLFSQIQTMSYETYSLDWKGVVPPGGDSNIKMVGMLVKNFEIDPYGRPIWAWLAHFFNPERDLSGRGSSVLDPLKVNKTSLKTNLLHFFACNSKQDLEG